MSALVAGCCAPEAGFVESQRLTYEAIAPEYRRYVDEDGTLSSGQRKRRYRTIEGWAASIEAAEKLVAEEVSGDE